MPNSLRPHGLQPVRLLCPWDFPGKEYWSGLPFPSPGIEPGSPALQADALPSEPPGKPKRNVIVKKKVTLERILISRMSRTIQ